MVNEQNGIPAATPKRTKGESDLARWLIAEISGWISYHNHKEVMAWLAAALFITICGVLIASPALSASAHNVLPFAVGGGAVGLVVYLQIQLRKRWVAADCLSALRLALLEEFGEAESKNIAAEILQEIPAIQYLPASVAENYAKARTPRPPAWAPTLHKPREWTERISLILILGVGVGTAWWLYQEKTTLPASLTENELLALQNKIATLESLTRTHTDRVDRTFGMIERLDRTVGPALTDHTQRLEALERSQASRITSNVQPLKKP